MSNKVYNILKWITLIALPALSTLIFGLSGIWGFDAVKIIGSIAAVETFTGALIGVSTYQYNKNQNEKEDGSVDEKK